MQQGFGRGHDLGPDLEAARADAGADGGADVRRVRADGAHLRDGSAENIGHRATPAAVHRADDPGSGVVQQHRQAVGHKDRERDARFVRDKAVAGKARLALRRLRVGGVRDAHVRAVDLPRIHRACEIQPGGHAEPPPVFAHVFGRVAAADTEVQALEHAGTHAAEAGGKGVARRDVRRGQVRCAARGVQRESNFVMHSCRSSPYTSWAGRSGAACRTGTGRCGRAS